MKVILIENVDGLGKAGDLVNAKPGYFNNYLAKNGLAVLATPDVVKRWKAKKKEEEQEAQQRREDAQDIKKKIEDCQVVIKAKGGEGGRLFGSVTAQDIADALNKELGTDIDKKKIELKDSIRNVGNYHVDVRVYPETVASLKVQVEEA